MQACEPLVLSRLGAGKEVCWAGLFPHPSPQAAVEKNSPGRQGGALPEPGQRAVGAKSGGTQPLCVGVCQAVAPPWGSLPNGRSG